MAIPLKNETAEEIAQRVYNDWLKIFPIPERIISDQAGNFNSDICKAHPQADGQVERVNKVFGDMLANCHYCGI